MGKTITINVPVTTVRSKSGKSFTTGGYERTFTQDDAGRWSSEGIGAMLESEVIDCCKKAKTWPEIRREHFPMHGF